MSSGRLCWGSPLTSFFAANPRILLSLVVSEASGLKDILDSHILLLLIHVRVIERFAPSRMGIVRCTIIVS